MKSVRIFYRKVRSMKFISHLDMNRTMSRIIFKSKIPVWYTEGYNQHIYMNFAVPLSLGYEGFYEVLDIRFTDDNYSLESCLEALREVSPADIEFIGISEAKMPMKDIGYAEYVIDFQNPPQDFMAVLGDFLKSESVICRKTGKKGRVKEFDIIPRIKSWSVSGNKLKITVTAGGEDNLNPSLILDSFFENKAMPPVFYGVRRIMLFNKSGEQFL